MNMPDSNTTPTKWIMWAAGLMLVTLVGLISPIEMRWKTDETGAYAKVLAERMDIIVANQNILRKEHQNVSLQNMIQCFNHAENVPDERRRHLQIRRCISWKLNPEQE
jgi:hypothetical protein